MDRLRKHTIVLLCLWLISAGTVCLAGEPASGEKTATNDEIFEARGGYIHPYASLRSEWTDNLYNIDVDENDNFLTVFAPGIWVGLPRSNKISTGVSHYNEAIGGSRYTTPGSGSFARSQLYLLAALNYKLYSNNSDLDYTGWHVEGMFQYTLPAGLSFRITDRYTRDRDRFDLGSFVRDDFTVEEETIYVSSTPSRIRDYMSNQANIAVNFDMSEKFTGLFDYTIFYLDYDDDTNNAWLDRTDNKYSISLAYNHSTKTSAFFEYSQAFTTYDSEDNNDSDNTFIYGGVNWKGSAKTSLMAKGGYQVRKYGNIDSDDADTFTMEALFNYLITDKTKINFSLYRALEETDSQANRGRNTTAARFRYDQKFTYRIQGYCELWYEYNDYDGFDNLDVEFLPIEVRRDTRYMVKPGIQYHFKEWLMAELAYSFENRESSRDIYNFTTQTIFLSLNAAL